jgi:ABC-type multidrug transport system permease subunit
MEKQLIQVAERRQTNLTGSVLFLVAFGILFYFSYEICDYYYPYAWEMNENDQLTQRGTVQANAWNLLRYTIYDGMFLLLACATLWIKNRLSFALSVGIGIVVFCSFIDKAQGIHERNVFDALVILGGVFCCTVIYKTIKFISK